MRIKTYVIPQPPLPWSRPGLAGKRFFDAQTKDKLVYKITLESQHKDEHLFSKPVSIDMTFFMAMPNVVIERRKKSGIEECIHHCVKPDIDNLVKFVFDAIKNVIITDDKIIYSMTAKKLYDSNPRTEFTIKEI